MIKALYISYDGMTDNLGQSQVIPYIKGLSEKGIKFTILSFEKEHIYKKKKKAVSSLLKESEINWIPVKYTKSPPIISTIKDILTLINTSKKLHKKYNFTIIHCRSYISSIAGLYLKSKYGVKFIFDMRGFWADERIDGNIWNIKIPIYKWIFLYFKSLEKKFLHNADYIISLTHSGKNIIKSWDFNNNTTIDNIEVIPCCTDFNHFTKNKKQHEKTLILKKELNIDNNFVLSYLGSIGTWYMLDEMLDFFKILLKQKPESIFLFITGDTPNNIYTTVKDKNIDKNKIIVVSSNREDVPAYIAMSSISIFFIKPLFSKKASSPTKLAEIMSMGIPVICNDIGDIKEIIEESESGLLVNEFNNKEYDKTISKIDDILKVNKEKIRNYSLNKFSLNKGIDRYFKIYNKLHENNK